MRTESELREALTDLAATAPHPASIRLTAPARRRPRPFVLVAALAGLALLAVLIPYVVVQRSVEPADRRVPGYLRMISRVTPPAGWEVTRRGITTVSSDRSRSFEYTALSPASGPTTPDGVLNTCEVYVYGRGGYSADPHAGRQVDLGGRPAWYVSSEVDGTRLVWAYDDDAYAVATCNADGTTAEDLAPFALGTSVGEPVDILLPFRLTDLPAGYEAIGVAATAGTGVAGDTERPTGGVTVRSTDGSGPGFDVVNGVVAQTPPGGPGMPGIEELNVRGYATLVREDLRLVQLTVPGPRTGYLRLTSYGDGQQSWLPGERDRLLAVAADLRPADDVTDPSTWIPAVRAVP